MAYLVWFQWIPFSLYTPNSSIFSLAKNASTPWAKGLERGCKRRETGERRFLSRLTRVWRSRAWRVGIYTKSDLDFAFNFLSCPLLYILATDRICKLFQCFPNIPRWFIFIENVVYWFYKMFASIITKGVHGLIVAIKNRFFGWRLEMRYYLRGQKMNSGCWQAHLFVFYLRFFVHIHHR